MLDIVPFANSLESGSKPFDTLIVFLKVVFEKVNFEKNQQATKIPSMLTVRVPPYGSEVDLELD